MRIGSGPHKAESGEHGERSEGAVRLFVRYFVLVLYLAPVAYCGALLGIAVHEFIGHGVTAWALGGEFSGFALRANVMGWAWAYPARDAPGWHEVAILAGGVI